MLISSEVFLSGPIRTAVKAITIEQVSHDKFRVSDITLKGLNRIIEIQSSYQGSLSEANNEALTLHHHYERLYGYSLPIPV